MKSLALNPRLAETLERIGGQIAENGEAAEQAERFSEENYALLQQEKIFSALVPEALGGAGHGYRDLCSFLRELAALHPSTALACSMHQHIVAANRYNHLNGRPGQAVLEKVAARELVLVSTGAGDWLASNGQLEKTEGGFIFNGVKHFASGSPAGDVLVTSAPYEDPAQGWQVLHFPVPLGTEGVKVLDNWTPLGMRGSGSNSVSLENVFVPEVSIVVRRPRGDFHLMWCVVLPVALPLIMSVYYGTAREAARRTRDLCRSSLDPVTPYLLGEMENALTCAEVALNSMIDIVDEFGFSADLATVNEVVKRKTLVAEACKGVTAKALEASGGRGFMRGNGIENLLRDVMASHFHPLQEKRQHLFTGSLAMGKEPPTQAF